jgi:tRNA(Met) C34 N-acetyltransferase TmcA
MAEALQTSDEAELSLDAESAEVDGALLELEQALHRREALIVVTSHRGRQHSSLVRTALARFDEAYVVVLISPANAEPILALDRLLETAGHEIGNATGEEKQAALGGLIDRAGSSAGR